MRNPTSISLFPIEFNGKNGVFFDCLYLSGSQGIFLYIHRYAKNKKIPSRRFLQHPDLNLMSVKPEGLLGDIKTANVFHHPVKAKI